MQRSLRDARKPLKVNLRFFWLPDWRPGVGGDASKFVIFLEGGGWCWPSAGANVTGGDNCLNRSTTALGSSTGYPDSIPNTGYEGGTGFLDGDPTSTGWANWAVAYVKYCDGGSFTGTRETPEPRGLHYRGKANLDAVLDDLSANHGMKTATEVVLSGCSAGGMACYLHCDYVAEYVQGKSPGVRSACICDAGIFRDVPTVEGKQIMRERYTDMVAGMNSSLPENCLKSPPAGDPALCAFSEHALATTKTPTFILNSLYNFGVWEELSTNIDGGLATGWSSCAPGTGGITSKTWEACDAEQRAVIDAFRTGFLAAIAPALMQTSPHGAFLDSCPGQHCQTSTGWGRVNVAGVYMSEAVRLWYFENSTVKLVDTPFMHPTANPTC